MAKLSSQVGMRTECDCFDAPVFVAMPADAVVLDDPRKDRAVARVSAQPFILSAEAAHLLLHLFNLLIGVRELLSEKK